MINIGGLQKLTLLDFPEKISCIIFLQGCNFNCAFCHNQSLIHNENEILKEEDIFDFLRTRVGILDGVCISGGEPTIYKDLPIFIKNIKDMGFSVKLDTNGTNPHMIRFLIDNNLIDYIAMDIKNSPLKYNTTSNCNVDFCKIKESVNIILENKINYEFRTTIMMEKHQLNDFIEISKLIKGANKYFLQKFKNTQELKDNNIYFTSPNDDFLNLIKLTISENVPNTFTREE